MLELAEIDEVLGEAPAIKRHSVKCSCGRFAKFLRLDKWYNGMWNMETLHVRCSRCGDTSIELV